MKVIPISTGAPLATLIRKGGGLGNISPNSSKASSKLEEEVEKG